jgi:molecular chaperone GrpE
MLPMDEEDGKIAPGGDAPAPGPGPSGGEGTAAPAPAVADGAAADLQDRYLRLAAEFDNFRKRTARERTELWSRAQADLVGRLADALDDLARFAHLDPAAAGAKAIHDGMALVERKVWKALDALGVERLDETGVPFDPTRHEAVTTQPAADPARDHTVGAVLQPGYRIGDLLIRPARVVVQTWRPDGGPPASGPGGDPAASEG